MIKKTIKAVSENQFLKSSSIVFSVNMVVGVLNYTLVIFASRFLDDQYSVWAAMTGVMTILLTPMAGLMTEFTKNASKLDKKSNQDSFNYFQYIIKKANRINQAGIVVGVLSVILYFSKIFDSETTILFLIVSYSLFNILANFYNQYLLSTLSVKQYAISIIATAFGRFIPTVFFLYIGAMVFSLPLGLLSSAFLGILVSSFYIKKFSNVKNLEKNIFDPKNYNILNQLKASSKNIIILLFVMTFFNIAPIISQRFFEGSDRDLFAVLYSFGQIIHFGSIAFMSALVAYAARGKDLKIYLTSVGIVGVLTSLIGLMFFLFGEWLLIIFDRTQYLDQIPLILLYSVFIAFFNIVFVSIQYLISHSEYKTLYALPFIVAALIASLIAASLGKLPFFGTPLVSFINTSIFFSVSSSIYFFVMVLRNHKQ